jgi:hypothetical protein
MVQWNAEKDQIVRASSRPMHFVFADFILQILKGIFKFHDIKSSAPLLKYLASHVSQIVRPRLLATA